MTHFNRYANNQPANFQFENTAELSKFSKDSIIKNADQESNANAISPTPRGDQNDPNSWLLM